MNEIPPTPSTPTPSSPSSALDGRLQSPFTQDAETIASHLQTDLSSGLTEAEAQERLQKFGPNQMAAAPTRSRIQILLSQLLDFMPLLLLGAAVISATLGDWIDAVLIGLIILANGLIGFSQEWRADHAIEALKELAVPKARVRRDGSLHEVPAVELVPGDLVEVKAGDLAPADIRLVLAADLEADESALTGESLPTEKRPETLSGDPSIGDRRNMLHMGTSVARGRGTGIVTSTGMQTELGQIAELLQETVRHQTPLQIRLAGLTRTLALAVLGIAILVFAVGVLREPTSAWTSALVGRMLLTAVSLGVAAIPEGLPAMITISLALGAHRMARRNAIIRRLSAVETLGTVDVICTDKTGTLTQNRMTLSKLIPADDSETGQSRLLEAMVLCSDAEVVHGESVGSATEVALLQGAVDHKIDIGQRRTARPRIAEIPFSSDRKRMSTLHPAADEWELIVKGAADRVLPLCQPGGTRSPDEWRRMDEELALTGQRVLAFARRSWNRPELPLRPEEAEAELEFLGLVGLVDPVRPEVKDAIERCLAAGIRPVMITGDHPGTARAIAESVGILSTSTGVVEGPALDAISQEELERQADQISVYARVSPAHKMRIIQALQACGRTSAMTGDGVNDAPALRQADIGIAMGITGTDVSRGAAAMVLADDNFATIVHAIEEGRVVYDNIRKFIVYLLTTNTAEVLVMLLAIVAGMPLPLLPIHILWINLVTDGLPALALAYEPAESDTMRRPPRNRDESLFSDGVGRLILLIGSVMAITAFLSFWWAMPRSAGMSDHTGLARARTVVFTVLSFTQLFYALGVRSLSQPIWRIPLLSNLRLIGAVVIGMGLQVAIIELPFLEKVFHTSHLTLTELMLAGLIAALPLVALEIWKVGRRRHTRTA
jgi:Ca2+-transporting ATPase